MNFNKLTYILSSLIFISCASSETTETNTPINENVPTIDLSEYDTAFSFNAEKMIDLWALRNPETFYYSFKGGKTSGQKYQPDTLENGLLKLGFLSFDRDEKINLYMYPSDSAYSFSVIELQPATQDEADEKSGFFGIYKDPIYTGNKIRLGAKKSDILKSTGEPMNIETNNDEEILKYWIDGRHIWLHSHNAEKYFLTYYLKDEKVTKIHFGFEPFETK